MTFLSKIRAWIAILLTPGPLHPLTEDERAHARHRRVLLSAIASALAKVISVSTALISVPLTLKYLGSERYGMWMTMTSVIAVLWFADLGLGNGVLSLIASANGKDDAPAIRRYVSSGFFTLTLMACVVLLLFGISYSSVTWHKLFNVHSEAARSEAGPALAVFILLFALNLPLSVVGKTQMGLQQGFNVSLWQCGGSVLSLVGVLLTIYFEGSLPWLIFAVMGGPLVASLMNNFQFFGRRRPDLRPSFAWVHFSDTKSIARTGVMFLILQIAGAIAYSSDNILIAQFLGASAVTSYAVPEKLFSLIGITLAMLLSPLWPAYGEAIARGDTAWVKKTLWRSLKISGLAAAALSTAMVLLGPWLLSIWIGHAVQPSLVLLLGLGVWKVLEAIGTATAAFLNGGRIVRLQTSFAVLTALAALAFKALAISWWSISAIPWAMSLAYVLLSLIPYAIFVPRVLK